MESRDGMVGSQDIRIEINSYQDRILFLNTEITELQRKLDDLYMDKMKFQQKSDSYTAWMKQEKQELIQIKLSEKIHSVSGYRTDMKTLVSSQKRQIMYQQIQQIEDVIKKEILRTEYEIEQKKKMRANCVNSVSDLQYQQIRDSERTIE